jgi:hypothetical protein
MVGDIPAAVAPVARPAPAPQPWPAKGVAYYGLTVIILATMLNFFDAQVFGMMAQRIKVDFHLTDEQTGALLGTLFVEWLAKRYKDANLRAAAIMFAIAGPLEIIAPLMPSAALALVCLGGGLVCGLATAVPQNAAIQGREIERLEALERVQ